MDGWMDEKGRDEHTVSSTVLPASDSLIVTIKCKGDMVSPSGTTTQSWLSEDPWEDHFWDIVWDIGTA